MFREKRDILIFGEKRDILIFDSKQNAPTAVSMLYPKVMEVIKVVVIRYPITITKEKGYHNAI